MHNDFIILIKLFAVVFGIAGLLIWLIVNGRMKKRIVSHNEQGVTTKAGKQYAWAELERINFINLKIGNSSKEQNHSMFFFFKNGQATTNFRSPVYNALFAKANELNVPKEQIRTVGRFKK